MVGLDAAGKTTILYKIKLGEIEYVTPTIGFNLEQVTYRNITFNGTHDSTRHDFFIVPSPRHAFPL